MKEQNKLLETEKNIVLEQTKVMTMSDYEPD